jgi:DNA-binding transcriptional LysR family regulator
LKIVDLDDIRLFVLAAERLNISAAGRELGLPPAVASARLARLERRLGADLLKRSTRKMALSVEGAEFLPFAREMLAQERSALAALGRDHAGATGTLRFAAPSGFATLYLSPLLPRFLERHPRLTLDLRLTDLPFDPIEGSYDLALRYGPLPDSSLRCRKLADSRRILCAAPDYLRRHGMPQAPDDLAGHQLIAFRRPAPRELVAADGRRGVFDPRQAACRLQVDDGLNQRALTVAGAGIAVLADWIADDELRSGRLLRVLPDFEVRDGTALWLVYPEANVVTRKVRALIDFLLAEIGERPPWGAVATD